MTEQLDHIFDKSACLSKRQLKDYVNGTMSKEECYALEHHLNSCFFCGEAIEGMMDHHEEALVMTDQLSISFLKDHFSLINPQIHLNSMAPATSVTSAHTTRKYKHRLKNQPNWKTGGIAAILLIGLGIMWYVKFGNGNISQKIAAGSTLMTVPAEVAAAPATQGAANVVAANTVEAENNAGNETDKPDNEFPQKPPPLIMTDQNKAVDSDNVTPEKKDIKSQGKAAVTAYKVPSDEKYQALINISSPSAQPEKSVAREIKDTDDGNQMAARGRSAKYDEAEAPLAASKKNEVTDEIAGDEPTAEELYFSGKWAKALVAYKKQMGSIDIRQRQKATIMSARCYVNLGQNAKAIPLLKSLIDEGGPQKKAAKRMLKDIDPAAVE